VDLKTWKSSADFALRLAFFAAAPFVVVFAAELFPVTSAILQVALALLVFLFGETARRVLGKQAILRRLFAHQLAFEAYYRNHAPRPFLYYVFYPLLLPYWLVNRGARGEFFVYKGYTWPALCLLVVSLVVQYFRLCPPELHVREFLPIALGSLLAEIVVVLMFLMPIVTSVIHLHGQRAPRRLSALLVVGLISVGYAIYRVERRRDPIVSFATRTRVRLRSDARPDAALSAQRAALEQAAHALDTSAQALPTDGRITGAALELARAALLCFYKNDEAYAFELWYDQRSRLLTLFFPARRGHAAIWLSRTSAGETRHDPSLLSERARRAFAGNDAPSPAPTH